MLIAFHKPCGVLSQFTPDGSPWRTLKAFGFPPRVYPIGRLDAESEGLLLLSDEAIWTDTLLNPQAGHSREYWVQIERIPEETTLDKLRAGMMIQGQQTRPCRARLMNPPPAVPPRDPPVRFRKNVPDCWIALELVEGRNRQVRRMTAYVGHPTLRLVRARIGGLWLSDLGLQPGKWVVLAKDQIALLTALP